VTALRQVKGSQPLLRDTAITPSGNPVYWCEGAVGPYTGFRMRVSGSGWEGCGVSLLVITRGNLALTGLGLSC
jgi:hypothetical protein